MTSIQFHSPNIFPLSLVQIKYLFLFFVCYLLLFYILPRLAGWYSLLGPLVEPDHGVLKGLVLTVKPVFDLRRLGFNFNIKHDQIIS